MRSKEDISAAMAKVKSSNTAPEAVLKNALLSLGFEIDENSADIHGKPDIVLPRYHLAIFVDGDFWHGNQWKLRGLKSIEEQFTESENKEYWVNKIQKNVIRDSRVTYDLVDTGWIVIRLWESQIDRDLQGCIQLIVEHIRNRMNNPIIATLPQKTVAEFFAGIGLMRMGLENQGWKVVFANDFDPEKIQMYQNEFVDKDEIISAEDIHKLEVDLVPSVTLATASFPCNDLSLAGGRLGLNAGKQSSAFWGFVRVLSEKKDRKPPLILLENVVGFLTSKQGEEFKQALLTLNEMGYAVDTFILDAANFVPQSRKRLFIVGMHKDILPEINKEFFLIGTSNSRPEMISNFIIAHPEIQWNIRALPDQPTLGIHLENILEEIPDDSSFWWSEERARYLLNQMSPKHREVAEKMIAGPKYSYGTVFRRVRNKKSMAELRADGIAGCLRTPRGGSGRQILFKAGFGKYYVRLLSPRECARLMGADNFEINVSLNQALFGFGDAVCVPVIEWIAKHYLNPLVNELIHEVPLTLPERMDHKEDDQRGIQEVVR